VEPEQTQNPEVIPESGSAFCVEHEMKAVGVGDEDTTKVVVGSAV
jgi:hypothetical protein